LPVSEAASLFDRPDEEAEERSMAEAEAQVAAGQFILHGAMVEWLLSSGTTNELPPPKVGE